MLQLCCRTGLVALSEDEEKITLWPKIPGFVATQTAGKISRRLLNISSSFINVETLPFKNIQWFHANKCGTAAAGLAGFSTPRTTIPPLQDTRVDSHTCNVNVCCRNVDIERICRFHELKTAIFYSGKWPSCVCCSSHRTDLIFSLYSSYKMCCMKVKFTCRGKEKGNRSPSRASGCEKKRKKHEYGAGWFWKQTRCQHHFSEHNVLKVFD